MRAGFQELFRHKERRIEEGHLRADQVHQSVKTAAFTYSERGRDRLATSVRTRRYRYTLWPSGEAELYDHDVDPQEYVNLAGDPDYSTVVEEMRALIGSRPGTS